MRKAPPPPPPPKQQTAFKPDLVQNEADHFLSRLGVLNDAQTEADTDEYFEQFQAQLLNEASVSTSVVSAVKKTPFQLKKEAEEAKRKRDEEEAARALKEFTASFEDDTIATPMSVPGFSSRNRSFGKTWVKAAPAASDEVPSSSEDLLYRPHLNLQLHGEGHQSQSMQFSNPMQNQSQNHSMCQREAQYQAQNTQKTRQLDAFLEEIKTAQSSNAPRASQHAQVGSHDTGDKSTTNLFISNLNQSSSEQAVLRFFAVYGPIGSVKIMWPRTQEELDRGRNTGFVGFMHRRDAESALKGVDGVGVLDGRVLRVGWGKAVPLPSKPIFELNPDTRAADTGLPFNAQVPSVSLGSRKNVGPPPRPEVRIIIPEDLPTLMRIHRTIEFVLLHGPGFEAMLMEKEVGNRDYTFLSDHAHPEHHYYRWKLFSLLHGDSKSNWRLKPFCMYDEGALWIPPPIPFDETGESNITDTDTASSNFDSSSDSESQRRQRATKRRHQSSHQQSRSNQPPIPKQYLPRHKQRLQTRLRTLQNTRTSIARAMLFCLSHATTNPQEIATTITESLMHPRTPLLPAKIARLHLVSDILHNSASPHVQHAWKYRGLFEKALPRVFRHFGECWSGVDARLRAEQWRRAVFGVISVWEKWSVFDVRFLDGLKVAFQEGATGSKDSKEGNERHAQSNEGDLDNDVDGAPMDFDTAVAEADDIEASKPAGFKPIESSPGPISSSKFAPIGGIVRGPAFVSSSKATASVAAASVVAKPAMAKKVNRVVAGAASAFQDDTDESE